MNRSFLSSAHTFIDHRKDARSKLVRGHASPVTTGGGSLDSRMGPDGLFPATDDERRAHFRESFRRTLAAVAIAGVALGGTIALIAAWTSL